MTAESSTNSESARSSSLSEEFNIDRSPEILRYVWEKACIAPPSAIDHSIIKIDDDYHAQAYAHAIRATLADDPHLLSQLSPPALAELLDASTSENFRDQELTSRLLSEFEVKDVPEYIAWTHRNRYQLILSIHVDPDLMSSIENWPNLSEAEKLSFAKNLVELDAELRGFKAPTVSSSDLSGWLSDVDVPEWLQTIIPKVWMKSVHGGYDYIGEDGIRLNNDGPDQPLGGANIRKAISTITHESEHAFQNSLTEKMKDIRQWERSFFDRSEEDNDFVISKEDDPGYYHFMHTRIQSLDCTPETKAIYEELMMGGALRNVAIAIAHNYEIYVDSVDSQSVGDYENQIVEDQASNQALVVSTGVAPIDDYGKETLKVIGSPHDLPRYSWSWEHREKLDPTVDITLPRLDISQ